MKKRLVYLLLIGIICTSIDFNAKEVNKNLATVTSKDIDSSFDTAEIVRFNDPLFEQCVRTSFFPSWDSDRDITADDLKTQTSLNCSSYGMIEDLTGIEYMENLTSFSSENGYISNLEPLRELINLERLDLSSNSITDLSPLENLEHLNFLDVEAQYPEINMTVYTDDEIFYNVISPDGTRTPISLGIPTEGTHTVLKPFTVRDINIGSVTDELFTGMITAEITYIPTEDSVLTGNSTARLNEETILTDDELIALFEVNNSSDLDILVDDSTVNYSTPGTYTIVFTDSDENELTSTIEIVDLLPEISTTITEAEISLGEEIDDFITLYGLTATEISDGDLTDQIIIDDSTVNYSTPGTYTFTVSVKDEEGNEDSTELFLVINSRIDTGFKPEIKGLEKTETNEEKSLSDEQLINLFEISVFDNEDGESIADNITVDQSLVDYSRPGLYNVIFTVTDSDNNVVSLKTQLEIIDLIPTLEVDSEEITLDLNSNEQELQNQLNAIASEIVKGDLTDKIVLDDSKVDYDTAGLYDVILSVVDEEGNIVKKIVTISVEDEGKDLSDIVSELTNEDIEDSINAELINSSEDPTESFVIKNKDISNTKGADQNKDEYIEMSLEETGQNNFILLVICIVFTFTMITLKYIFKTSKIIKN